MDSAKELNLLLECKSREERQVLLADIFTGYSDRLHSMVRLRLDRRLQARVDPSDVLQDVYLEASRRLGDYLRKPCAPLFLWLRRLTGQRLLQVHRFHLGAQRRGAAKEISIDRGAMPHTTSEALAMELLAHGASPSAVAAQSERKASLEEALRLMEPIDREILALRHFEQLSSAQAAQLLGIEAATARKRYLRAIGKLREILQALPGNRLEP